MKKSEEKKLIINSIKEKMINGNELTVSNFEFLKNNSIFFKNFKWKKKKKSNLVKKGEKNVSKNG